MSSRQRLTPRRRMPAPNPPWPPSASRRWMLTPLKRAGSKSPGPEKVDAEKDLARAAALRSVASRTSGDVRLESARWAQGQKDAQDLTNRSCCAADGNISTCD